MKKRTSEHRVALTRAQQGAPAALGYRLPAEWEAHEATWIAWPCSLADWPGKEGAIPWVFAEMVRHLHSGERVRILVPSLEEERRVRAVLGRVRIDLDQLDFVIARTNRTWARDFMPLFVTRAGGEQQVAAVKWLFNGWCRYRNHRHDDRAGELAADWLGLPIWRPEASLGGVPRRLVLEGGGIEVDGEGTIIVTTECLISGAYARNPELGRAGHERALKANLGVTKVIWVERGIAGDDTSGHTDDFVRFVTPGRVLLCHEPNREDPNHRVLREVREKLERTTDARGRRLEIVALPMPAPVWFGRIRLPASYANYYVGNEVVIVPTFNDPRDAEALGILREQFPGRLVVGVYAGDLVLGLGTLHCSTMQQARGGPSTFGRQRRRRVERSGAAD